MGVPPVGRGRCRRPQRRQCSRCGNRSGSERSRPLHHGHLPHLGQTQAQKKVGEAVTGEMLLPVIGGHGERKKSARETVLALFGKKYGIEDEDFATAELEIIPPTMPAMSALTALYSRPRSRRPRLLLRQPHRNSRRSPAQKRKSRSLRTRKKSVPTVTPA